MNNKVILILILQGTLACSFKTEKQSALKPLEGWAGHPDSPNEKPFDYFYTKYSARASKRSLDRNNGEMMKATCIDMVTAISKRHFERTLINKTLPSRSYPSGKVNNPNLNRNKYSAKINRNPNAILSSPNFLNLVTISHATPSSLIIEKIKEIKVRECKPLAVANPENPMSGWKECECSVYGYIPGGQESLSPMVEMEYQNFSK